MGSSISGRNMPELPISTHFLSPSCHEKISSEGCDTKRVSDVQRKRRRQSHFCVRVVSGLEAKICNAHLGEEDLHESW